MKTIVITGATTGIGKHATQHLARRGHRVIATGRNPELLEALRRENGVEVVRLDVTDERSVAAAVEEIDRLTSGEGIDALVNNAGYGHPGALEDVSDADLRRQFDTNVFGLMAVTRAFLPQLKRRRGRLVNLSSVGGRVTFPLFGAYHASKYAVEALSDALRYELAPFGVKVAVIEPGPIRTEFGNRALETVRGHARPGSAYAPVYARAEQIKALTDRQEADPIVVSRAIERAITARRPRARTVVPFSSRVLVCVMRALPGRWVDALVRRLIGLTPRGLRVDDPRARLLAAGR